MDVHHYFQQRERECGHLSLVPETTFADLFSEEEGSNGMRGRMLGTLWLMSEGDEPRAYLAVSELVVVEGNHVHREEYGYFLIVDGVEVCGWERDLSHDPPVHRHVGPGHKRVEAEAISFRAAVGEAWQELSRQLSLAPDDAE